MNASQTEKRSNPYGSTSDEPPKKVFKAPAAGSLVMMESTPRIQRPQRLPAVAPFLICIYKAGACNWGRTVLVDSIK